MVIESIVKSGRTAAELYDYYQVYAESGELNLEAKDAPSALQALAERYADGRQDQLDGLTVRYDDWWFNARASNTEPLLRLNIEAKDAAILQAKQDEILSLLAS